MTRRLTIATIGTVALVASSAAMAKAPRRCVVPRLTGDTLSQARHRLAQADCRLGRTTGPRSGRVISQGAKAGLREKRGAKIAVTLAAPKTAGSTPTTLDLSVSGGSTIGDPGTSTTARVQPTLYRGSNLAIPIDSGAPVVLTIADITTGQTIESFRQAADTFCAITVAVGNGTVTFTAPRAGEGTPCGISPFTGSQSDRYTVTARFAGSATYAPSTSSPEAL